MPMADQDGRGRMAVGISAEAISSSGSFGPCSSHTVYAARVTGALLAVEEVTRRAPHIRPLVFPACLDCGVSHSRPPHCHRKPLHSECRLQTSAERRRPQLFTRCTNCKGGRNLVHRADRGLLSGSRSCGVQAPAVAAAVAGCRRAAAATVPLLAWPAAAPAPSAWRIWRWRRRRFLMTASTTSTCRRVRGAIQSGHPAPVQRRRLVASRACPHSAACPPCPHCSASAAGQSPSWAWSVSGARRRWPARSAAAPLPLPSTTAATAPTGV